MIPDGKVQRVQLPAGVPTLEQLAAMSKALTGRDPTPEELQKAQATLARIAARKANAASSSADQTDGSGQPPDGH